MDSIVIFCALLGFSVFGLLSGIIAVFFNKKLANEFHKKFPNNWKDPKGHFRYVLFGFGLVLLSLGIWAVYHFIKLYVI